MYDLELPTTVDPKDMPTETDREITFQSCLNMAECTFGPRDTQWDITLRLVQRRSPRRAPETLPYGQGLVKVRLYVDTVWEGFLLEAAHEAVHCLNPGNGATYLEEGIATAFSLAVVDGSFGQSEPGIPELVKRTKMPSTESLPSTQTLSPSDDDCVSGLAHCGPYRWQQYLSELPARSSK